MKRKDKEFVMKSRDLLSCHNRFVSTDIMYSLKRETLKEELPYLSTLGS
jgi:hypothetical protein